MALSRSSNPLIDNPGMENIPLRTAPWNPAGGGGLGDYSGTLSSMEAFGRKAYEASLPDFGTPPAPAPVKAFSPSSGKLFVNGFTFDVDDAQRALESEQYLGAAPQPLPAGDWIPLDDESYSAYLEGIRNPSIPRLAAKNFGRGVDISQLLAGRALQFAGAEDIGGRVVESQMEDLRKTSPYERMFTDIGSQPNRGVLDWFVANLAQQGPNLVESAVTALVGAGVGAAAGGGPNPFSAAGGALAALAGRQSVKQSMLAAAKKYSRGETLDAAETKLLHEQAGILAAAKIKEGTLYGGPQGLMTAGQFTDYIKPTNLANLEKVQRAGLRQAQIGGAAAATGLQNYVTGVADVYGEGIEGGNPDRMYAAMAGIPYAAFETLPEFLLAGRVFGNLGGAKPRIRDIPGLGAKAAAVGRRAGAGFVQGGLIEGATEASQEGLLFGANEDVDWNSPEGINRLVNSFAAGFGVGGPIGSVFNVAGKLEQNKPANLLDPAATTEPPAAETVIKPPAPEPAPPTAELMPRVAGLLGGPGMQAPQGFPALMVPPLEPAAPTESAPPSPVSPPTGPGTVIPMPYAGAQTDNLLAPGQQGVLDIFGPMTEAELAQRAQPMQYGTEEVPAEGMQAPTGQGALQFAPPAPGGMRFTNEPPPPTGAIGQQLYALQQQQQLQQEFEAAQQQRQAELDAQREADFNRMEAQRQLQLAQQTETPVAAVTPKKEKLRRGKGKGRKPPAPKGARLTVGKGGQMEAFGKQKLVPVAPEPEAPAAAAGPAPKQLQLFTRTGKPTKEAVKGNKLKKGRKNVQERVAEAVPAAQPAGTGQAVGGTNAGAGATARKALPLRKGKARKKKFAVQEKQTVPVDPYDQADSDLYDLDLEVPTKGEVKKFAQRLVKQGLLTEEDISFIPSMMKDKDMSGEDIVSELRSAIRIAKDRAAEAEAALKRPKDEAAAKAAVVTPTVTSTKSVTPAVSDVDAQRKWFNNAPADAPSYKQLTAEQQQRWKDAIASEEDVDDAGKPIVKGLAKTLTAEYNTALKARAAEVWTDLMDDGTPDFTKFEELSQDAQKQWVTAVAANKQNALLGDKLAISSKRAAMDAEDIWIDLMDDGTDNFVKFYDLPEELRDRWETAVKTNKISVELGNKLLDLAREEGAIVDEESVDVLSELNDIVTDLKNIINSKFKSLTLFRENISRVIFYAFFDTDSNNARDGVTARALKFFSETEFAEAAHVRIAEEEFLKNFSERTEILGFYDRGKMKGQPKPWYVFAIKNNLLSIATRGNQNLIIKNLGEDEARARLQDGSLYLNNLPDSLKKIFAKEAKTRQEAEAATLAALATPVVTPATDSNPVTSTEVQLGIAIDALFGESTSVSFNSENAKKDIFKRLRAMYAKLDDAQRKYIVRGYPLHEYFRDDGTPKMRWGSFRDGARYIIGVDDITDQEAKDKYKEVQAQRAAADKNAREKAYMEKLFEFWTSNKTIEESRSKAKPEQDEGNFRRADGTPIKGKLAPGKIRMLVSAMMSKFKMTPKVYYYASIAELKAQNPTLYKAAKAAYKGDFDAAVAMGYSFNAAKDPTVILFTDYLPTEETVRFVVAHEVLGHFGFRSIMPIAELNKLLLKIYESDPDVQAVVDAEMELRGTSKLEAIEEYLADNAADVDASVLRQIWNSLKNFLNKLGFKFDDDAARYLVGQARKYVRTGEGSMMSPSQMMGDMETMSSDGRFATIHGVGDAGSRLFGSSGMLNLNSMNRRGGLSGVAEWFRDKTFTSRVNSPGTMSRLLNQIQTLDNKARRSYGLAQIYRMLEQQQGYARKLLAKYQRMTDFSHGFNVTEEDKLEAGELLANAALLRGKQATEEVIRNSKRIVKISADGTPVIDQAALNEIINFGFVTADEFRKGFTVDYESGPQKVPPREIDENSNAWKVYLEYRNAANEAAIDVMLSNFMAAQDESMRILTDLNYGRNKADMLSDDDIETIRMVGEMYKTLRYENAKIANAAVNIDAISARESEDFRVAFGLAIFSDEVFKVWMKDPAADIAAANKLARGNVADFAKYQDPKYDFIREQLPSLKNKNTKDSSFKIQKAIQDLFLFDLQAQNSEYYAKRTIMGSYVPFSRRGEEQVRLVAKDANGNYVELHASAREVLPYYQFEDRADALRAQEQLEEVFGNEQKWVMPVDDGAGNMVEKEVFLTAEVSRTRRSPDLTEAVNFNEFIYVLNRLNINLTPRERERVVTTLTEQNSKARKNLQRSGTPGWDKDVVRSASEFLEMSGHIAAKRRYKHRLDDIFLRQENWKGDDVLLRTLKRAVDEAATPGEKAEAQRVYAQYAYMYRYMKATGKGNKVEIDGKMVPTLGRGEDYKEEAKAIIRWYSENGNIMDSTEDVLSGEAGSRLKMITVLMQLGGSVATAVINLTSILTHSLPYLSFYNSAQGYGGGYGSSKAGAALFNAAKDIGNPNMADDKFLAEMVRNGTHAEYGLTANEAMFLLNATEQGILQAAQFNALIGTARGKVGDNRTQKAIQIWMSMFSYTEQMNRRTTALAAYRLERDRALAEGKSELEAAFAAEEAARKAVNYSQGEYAMFNRPEMARGNFMQYVFMYKQFAIITVQLLKAMPLQGRMLMLGLLFLSAGIRGLPFAEDIMDLLDTLLQKLGLKVASVEKAAIDAIEAIAPGVSPYVMNGLINKTVGATVSTRLGMGDLVPLTGAFRAGASPIRELENFAGPVWGALAGLTGTAASLTRYGAETIGIKDDTTSMVSILRDAPLAAVRSVGDAYAYTTDGMITNRKGQVVSSDVTPMLIATRLLGFYPNVATEQNDIVRLSKQVAEYAKEVKAGYVQAYVKASLADDAARMREIEGYVEEWNIDAEGTGLEISNFGASARRAAREAAKPTVVRYLKSAPKNVKPETVQLLEAAGYDVAEL